MELKEVIENEQDRDNIKESQEKEMHEQQELCDLEKVAAE
jgi:hypothetical protein